MSNIKIVEGNLLDFDGVDAIGHGCNTRGDFNAGVAGQVRRAFPAAAMNYEKAVRDGDFYPGAVQATYAWSMLAGRNVIIYNMATQVNPGADARPVLITLAVAGMVNHAFTVGRENGTGTHVIGLPRIGCGIGGLKWDDDVLPAIEAGLQLSLCPAMGITIFDYIPGTVKL